MFARTALGATLALGASVTSAFLLPPGVVLDSTTSNEAGLLNTESSHRSIAVKCKDCPYAEFEGRSTVWTEGVGNSLLFDLDTGVENDRLSINGATLFPPRFGLIPQPLYVHQIPSAVAPEDFIREHADHASLRLTGYEFRFDTAQTISEMGHELLPMQLTIHSIAGKAIPPKTLNIFMTKDIEGRLSIAHVTLEEVPATENAPAQRGPDCSNWPVVCKIKDFLAAKPHGRKMSFRKGGCHKSAEQGGEEGTARKSGQGAFAPSHRPSMASRPLHSAYPPNEIVSHPHIQPHGHHGTAHRYMHMLLRGASMLIVPVLAGIVAGLVSYSIGMVLGMAVWWVYCKANGLSCRYTRVADDEENGNGGDGDEYPVEKAVYDDGKMVEEEREAPPVYEEAVEKEVVVLVEKA